MVSKKLIQKVSRSFSLSLFFLPKAHREAVTLAYLLARFGDTLVDSGSWDTPTRLTHLENFENAILFAKPNLWHLRNFPDGLTDAEHELLSIGPDLLTQFASLPNDDRASIRVVIQKLFGAMKWDLSAFNGGTALNPIGPIEAEKQFDWYCENIAGCVGEFWVRIFKLPESLIDPAIKYGKALQRINIYRDAPEDLKKGRIYFSQSLLRPFGLEKNLDWNTNNWKNFSDFYLNETEDLLENGLKFSNAIFNSSRRLRWASYLPYGIGALTLKRLKLSRLGDRRVKISRSDVRGLALKAAWTSFFRKSFSSCSSA